MRLNRTSAVNNYEVPAHPAIDADMSGAQTVQALSVAIIGIGGIGGVVAEMLTRSGVGKLWLIDKGTVDPTHLNRYSTMEWHVYRVVVRVECCSGQSMWGSPKHRLPKQRW